MPHFKKDGQKNESEENSLNDTENGGDDTDGDFLSSIGLSKSQFASIEKQRFANEISQLNAVDNRAQSTVFVKDCHVNALFNFLVNSDVTVAQSGTWQGVPPTLLSPVAFEGASLQTMQCIQGPMKVPYKGGMKQVGFRLKIWLDFDWFKEQRIFFCFQSLFKFLQKFYWNHITKV